jgi:hypothetical protein
MTTRKKSTDEADPKIEPGAWKRFESAVDVLSKGPPQHKVAKKKSKGATGGKKKQ